MQYQVLEAHSSEQLQEVLNLNAQSGWTLVDIYHVAPKPAETPRFIVVMRK